MVAIADRLEQAAHTLRRLPKVTGHGIKSNWPPTVNEFHEAYCYNDAEIRLGPPTARHITEMDEALSWLLFLPPVPDYSGSSYGLGPTGCAGRPNKVFEGVDSKLSTPRKGKFVLA